jgi:hypothetical protein
LSTDLDDIHKGLAAAGELMTGVLILGHKEGAPQYGRHHAIVQPVPPPRCIHRRSEIDCALSNMTPKAVADAPLGLLAKQCHADADVEAAAAIAAPIIIAMRNGA